MWHQSALVSLSDQGVDCQLDLHKTNAKIPKKTAQITHV